MTPIITVYSKPDCVQCAQTTRWLDRAGLTYGIENVLDESNLAAAKALGHTSAPVVMVTTDEGTTDWSGFRPDLLAELRRAAA